MDLVILMVEEFKSGEVWVKIDMDKCTAAGECVSICPDEVYSIVKGKVTAKIEDCSECGVCAEVCPTGALVGHSSW